MKYSNQITNRLARAAATAAAGLWIANLGVVNVQAATNVTGAVLQGTNDGNLTDYANNNAATTISFSGQTALRSFDTSFAIQQLQPGTSITLHNGTNGAATTYTAPSDSTTNVKLASNNFTTPDVWKLNGSSVPVGTAGAQIQTNSALQLQWHEQGSIDGFYDLINDEIGYAQTSTEATNSGVTALGTIRPVGPISVLSQRVPSSANPTWINATSSTTNKFTAGTNTGADTPNSQNPNVNGFVLDASTSDRVDQTYNTAVYDPATGKNLDNGQNRIQFSVGEFPTEAFSVAGTPGVFSSAGSAGYGQGNPALAKASTLTALGTAGQRQQFQPAEITNETTAIKDPQTGLNYPAGPWNTATTNNVTSTNIAATAVTFSANPGTGLYRLTQGDTQWLQTTGRLENGALFNVVARTVDTGQRAVFALNTGVDPSWAVGSNDDGNSTGSNAIPQHSIGPSLRFDGKTAGSEADATIGANRLAVGALSVAEAKGATNGAVVRSLDIDFGTQTDVNPADDNLNTYIRPNFDSIVSDGTSDPNTSGAHRYQAVLISHYNTVKEPSPSALLAQEHADGILVGDNNTADSTNTSLVSAAVQQTEWGKVNSFNPSNLSDPTTSGIKGDVQYANGSTVVGGDVAAFISNIANSNAVVASGVGSVTNNANNPADGLLSIGFLPPTLLDWTRTTDGGAITPNVATGTTLTQQQQARTNYGSFFTLDGTSGANANTATSGLLYGGSGNNGNGLNINGNVPITTKNADGSTASNGAIVPAGNYLFGNFNQNGVRDFSAVKQAVNAALSLFAVDGQKNSMFTSDGVVANSTTVPSLVGTPSWATIGASGPLANTKGDLIVLGDFNGDGRFDGQDLYYLAIGASLADSTSVDTLSATATSFSDVVRDASKVLRKNAALDYFQSYLSTHDTPTPGGAAFLKKSGAAILTVPSITTPAGATAVGATALGLDPVTGFEQFTFDPNGNYTFDKHDVNRDGVVDFNDAILVDKFAGQSYGYNQTTTTGFNTALSNTLAATQQTPVSGTTEAVSLVNVQQIDGEAAIGASDLAELNIGLATNGPTNWYAYTLSKTGTGTINFGRTAGTVTVFAASTGTGPATYQITGGQVNVGKAVLNGSSQPAQTGTLTTIAGAIDPFTDSSTTGLDTSKSLAVSVNSGTLDYAARTGAVGDTGIMLYRLGSLSVQNGGAVNLDSTAVPANHTLLVAGSLAFAGTGKLDLGANDLVVHSGNITNIKNELASGRNTPGQYWSGSGIASVVAATDSRHLTTLGYRQSDGSQFDGQNTVTTDVLVKYTYYGDADLNGVVNGADYAQIDSGFGSHATGWYSGDFNNDGVVDGTDYALIDNTFNQINATGASPLALISDASVLIASPAAVSFSASSVPEPTSLGLLGIGAIGLLGQRRRRKIKRSE